MAFILSGASDAVAWVLKKNANIPIATIFDIVFMTITPYDIEDK